MRDYICPDCKWWASQCQCNNPDMIDLWNSWNSFAESNGMRPTTKKLDVNWNLELEILVKEGWRTHVD